MNKVKISIYTMAALICLLLAGQSMAGGTGSRETVRISVDDLRAMLGNPDLIVVDVRDPLSWSKSESKILGAVREDTRKVDSWSAKYSKDKTLVFY